MYRLIVCQTLFTVLVVLFDTSFILRSLWVQVTSETLQTRWHRCVPSSLCNLCKSLDLQSLQVTGYDSGIWWEVRPLGFPPARNQVSSTSGLPLRCQLLIGQRQKTHLTADWLSQRIHTTFLKTHLLRISNCSTWSKAPEMKFISLFHPWNVCCLKQFLKLVEDNRPPCKLIRGKCASPAHRDRRGSCQIILMLNSKSFQMGFLCSVFGGGVTEIDLVAKGCVFQRWRPPLWHLLKLSLTIHSLLQVTKIFFRPWMNMKYLA